jgi:glycosyltransferase involved in cell wall biosynthesis
MSALPAIVPAPFDATEANQPVLSVVVPVYNEERTVEALLSKLMLGPYPDKEVIIVDDGSQDATPRLLKRWADHPGVQVIHHERNLGKGAAVRTGLGCARGLITIIQDADLEYDPEDYPQLVERIRCGETDVVYGSRYLAAKQRLPWTKFRVAVWFLNTLVRLLYGQRITDEATCYKALRTSLLRDLNLQAIRFELCAEITAKVCRLGIPIVEIPISYHPRSQSDGKKIRWRDGWEAIWTLLKWRILPCKTRWGKPGCVLR